MRLKIKIDHKKIEKRIFQTLINSTKHLIKTERENGLDLLPYIYSIKNISFLNLLAEQIKKGFDVSLFERKNQMMLGSKIDHYAAIETLKNWIPYGLNAKPYLFKKNGEPFHFSELISIRKSLEAGFSGHYFTETKKTGEVYNEREIYTISTILCNLGKAVNFKSLTDDEFKYLYYLITLDCDLEDLFLSNGNLNKEVFRKLKKEFFNVD